jgi:hypothetical protein
VVATPGPTVTGYKTPGGSVSKFNYGLTRLRPLSFVANEAPSEAPIPRSRMIAPATCAGRDGTASPALPPGVSMAMTGEHGQTRGGGTARSVPFMGHLSPIESVACRRSTSTIPYPSELNADGPFAVAQFQRLA